MTVKDTELIHAARTKVWKVLTEPAYIRLWDELPDNYPDEPLALGTELNWEGFSKLTVTELADHSRICLRLYLPRVKLQPDQYHIQYRYTLSQQENATLLTIEVGDFSPLPNFREFFENTVAFTQHAKAKIKALAEALEAEKDA
jgi:hypothetical protein